MMLVAICSSHSTGKERDTESGNDYFGARYYAGSMGRFMSPGGAQRKTRFRMHNLTTSKA